MIPLLAADSGGRENFVDLTVHPWQWMVLLGLIVVLLLADLLIFHREAHEISTKEAAIESTVWISIGVAFSLVVWWWSSRDLTASVLPSPQAVLARLVAIATDPALAWHPFVTTLRVMASVLLSLVLGLALALAAHARPWLDGIISDRILVVLSGMPSVGWAILAVIWFRVSELTVVFVQMMILLPFALINFAEGLRNLDQEVIEMADSFSIRRSTISRSVNKRSSANPASSALGSAPENVGTTITRQSASRISPSRPGLPSWLRARPGVSTISRAASVTFLGW